MGYKKSSHNSHNEKQRKAHFNSKNYINYSHTVYVTKHAAERYCLRFSSCDKKQAVEKIKNSIKQSYLIKITMDGYEERINPRNGIIFVCKQQPDKSIVVITVLLNKCKQLEDFSSNAGVDIDYEAIDYGYKKE